MEEALIVIITFLAQLLLFLAQLLLESLVYFLFDILLVLRERRREGKTNKYGWALISLLMGTIIGGVSVGLFSNAVLPFSWLRVLSLVVAPFLAGALALRMSRRRNQKQLTSDNKLHYLVAFLFTLGFLGVRFVFAIKN